MTTYIAIIYKEADSDYGGSFPDSPGYLDVMHTIDAYAEQHGCTRSGFLIQTALENIRAV